MSTLYAFIEMTADKSQWNNASIFSCNKICNKTCNNLLSYTEWYEILDYAEALHVSKGHSFVCFQIEHSNVDHLKKHSKAI